MIRFRVWNPDEEGEDDAQYIFAQDAEDAAEIYLAPVVGSFPEDYIIRVADEDNNQYEVDVDVEPWCGDSYAFASFARKL